MDDPYIEPQQRAGYLKFLLVFIALAWFVPELWGLLLGFLYWFVTIGIPVFVVRWLIGKWFEVNRITTEAEDTEPDSGRVPWWLDRGERFRRN
jgi:hypothetical protein